MKYKKIPTSYEVWLSIKKQHLNQLKLFSSYSAPDGDYFGDIKTGVMMTEYGFDGASCPIMGAETKWDIDREHPYKKVNERHEYWLCVPIEE